MSAITQEARRQANLKLLQRTCDPHIASLLQTATHTVLYEFGANQQWNKCGVEGSCFLVATTTSTVQLIILNRTSANNFVLKVVPQLKVQEQDPFLILQQESSSSDNNNNNNNNNGNNHQKQSTTTTSIRTLGLWFHSADERVALTQELQSTVKKLSNQTFVFPIAAATTTAAAATPPPRAHPPPKATTPVVTQDERDHLAALLSQTALAAAGTRSQSAPKEKTPVASSGASAAVALDKKALQLTLLSLIQDERFLDLLHSQYLRVVHARVKKTNTTPGGNSSSTS